MLLYNVVIKILAFVHVQRACLSTVQMQANAENMSCMKMWWKRLSARYYCEPEGSWRPRL